jgi:prevent-host-death family protein
MQWSIADAKAKLSEVIQEVRKGEPAILTRNGIPVACVIPPPMRNVYQARLFQLKEQLGSPSISQMAEAMKLGKAGELGKFFDGEDEPSFDFLESVATRFRCKPQWLKHGESEDYLWEQLRCSYHGAEQIVQNLEKLEPKSIYFTRVDHQERNPDEDLGEAGIIVKWDNLTYQVFGTVVHVSDHVGHEGTDQLRTLCHLTSLLPQKTQWNIAGKVIRRTLFNDIFSGRKWAGLVERAPYSTWWDDLADFNHSFPISGPNGDGYALHYGESFRRAQAILKLNQ